MPIVSNTSPLISLATIDSLPLLERAWGKVLIPDAVYQEAVIAGKGKPGWRALTAATWLERQSVTDKSIVLRLRIDDQLDAGEAEAIALAAELRAQTLLMDERRGRRVAGRFGIRTIGLLGFLLQAKREGHLLAIRPLLNDLVHQSSFWLTPELYSRTLKEAGEAPL